MIKEIESHSLEDYLLAKERLFAEIIDNEGYAILNHDNHEFDRLSKISKLRNLNILSYGRNSRN